MSKEMKRGFRTFEEAINEARDVVNNTFDKIYEIGKSLDGHTNALQDDMEVKIKPCPLCGSHSDISPIRYTPFFRIVCSNDDCYLNCPNDWELEKKDLLEIWNKRVPEIPDVEDLIKECVPGGQTCDSQDVADNIREYFKMRNPESSD